MMIDTASPFSPHAKHVNALCSKLIDADGRVSPWKGHRHETHSLPLSAGTSQSGK